jgi:undecaprenyl-diphosphatase
VSGDLLRAAILGVLQGATEFLPVSSSGHLVIVPALLGWPASSLRFDVAVHWGTALAVLGYFRSDWLALLAGAWRATKERRLSGNAEARLLLLLAAASVPAALAGLLLQGPIESALASNSHGLAQVSAFFLMVTGLVLLAAELLPLGILRAEEVSVAGALVVGVAQAVSVLPGVSRSGATIATGLGARLGRPEAARFSFLLGGPAVLGAGLVELADMAGGGLAGGEVARMAVGFLTALIVGYAAIAFLLAYLRRASLRPFGVYCLAFGALAVWLLR